MTVHYCPVILKSLTFSKIWNTVSGKNKDFDVIKRCETTFFTSVYIYIQQLILFYLDYIVDFYVKQISVDI